MAVCIREYQDSDEAFVLSLNAACVPEVGEMDADRFTAIRAWSHVVLVAELDERPVGFLILLREGAGYDSDNFVWFESRFDRHLYIDRIAIKASARGEGIGRRLYQAVIERAQQLGAPRVTAEVNVAPPNPVSMAFHEHLGFRRLDARASGSAKVVAMLELLVAA